MNNKALLQLGAELLHTFRHGDLPADRALGEYLHKRKFLGASDRRFVSENFYHTLRHLRRIDEAILSAWAQSIMAETRYSSGFPVTEPLGAKPWQRRVEPEPIAERPKQRDFDRAVDTLRLGIASLERRDVTVEEVAEELERTWPEIRTKRPMQLESLVRLVERTGEVAALFSTSDKPMDEARRYSFPDWLWNILVIGRVPDELGRLGDSLLKQATATLRVNTLKVSVTAALSKLTESGIEFRPGRECPTAVVLEERVARGALPHMEDGWFEHQDEGSQLVSVFAAPEPGMTVVDACAGGGGKSLHLAALMKNRGQIFSMDSEPQRMNPLVKRGVRAGCTIIDARLKYGPKGELPSEAQLPPADLVIIDAPCTGTGTIRRSPDIKWNLTQAYLATLLEIQRTLLDTWASRVRVGGHLVYATCSLLHEENDAQARAFLERHPEYALDTTKNVPCVRDGFLKTQPHRDACDGFFAARFVRNS